MRVNDELARAGIAAWHAIREQPEPAFGQHVELERNSYNKCYSATHVQTITHQGLITTGKAYMDLEYKKW